MAALLWLLPAVDADAEEQLLVHGIEASGDPLGLFATDSALTLEPLQFSLGLTNHATQNLIVLPSPGSRDYETLPIQRLTSDLKLAFAPVDGVQLSASLPYITDRWINDGSTEQDIPSELVSGFGDLRIELRSTLFQKGERYMARGGPVAISLRPAVQLATGNQSLLPGTGNTAFDFGIALERGVGPARMLANLSYHMTQAKDAQVPLTNRDEVIARAGAAVTLWPYIADLTLEACTWLPLSIDSLMAGPPALQFLGGLRLRSLWGLSVHIGGGAGYFSDAPGEYRLFLALHQQWPANATDRDQDGILDGKDQCVEDPEDYDGFSDEDGCPEVDNDSDGRIDSEDACPNIPEDFDKFEDDDGCPEEDNDQDQLADSGDQCPNQAEDFDGFQDQDGCPDPDNDLDGLPDTGDACPLEPEDFDSYMDSDGCPDTDNDQDGLSDQDDECPDSPEDLDSFEDQDGCPEPDNDRDGILDLNDLCPNKPEDNVQSSAPDGCPQRERIVLQDNVWMVLEEILFAPNDDAILPRSFEILELLATRLRQEPAKATFLVQDYTDRQGDAEMIRRMSNKRAALVADFLVGHGIPADRIASVGYGGLQSMKAGDSTDGRARNRRIEVKVVMPKQLGR